MDPDTMDRPHRERERRMKVGWVSERWGRSRERFSIGARSLVLAMLVLASCSDGPTDPSGGPDPDPPGGGSEPYGHTLGAGQSARDFLADEEFDRLVVEVQYVEGYRPDPQVLDDLEAFLEDRLHKPGIEIEVADEPVPIESQPTYSANDVRSLEEEHRTRYTEGSTLAAYLLFLDGEYETPNVLGIAYYNTSMAIFAEKIDDHTGDLGQPSQAAVEAVVAKHEFGHLLGLVDNGSEMERDHRDPNESHGPHCENEDCLMYYAVRTTDVISQILGGTPELDDDCLNDLRANGGR